MTGTPHVLDINLLSDICDVQILYPTLLSYFFDFLIVSLDEQKFLIFMKLNVSGFFVFCFLSFLLFLGLLPRHMEVPRLGVELELQPPAYARAIATRDLSCVCNLHTPQLMATPDPQPTEWGQGSNQNPHGY